MLISSLSDAELWTAIRMDNAHALNLLFDRYWARLYKTAYNLTHDTEVSKEIVHDVFLNIWKRRNLLHINSFPHFLLTAIRYQYYNRMRAAQSPIVWVPDYAYHDTVTLRNEAEIRQEEMELTLALKQYLIPLPKRCQEIFLLSRNDHLTNEEIADQLHISKRTVENQITYALKYLRSTLKNTVPAYLAVLIHELIRNS
jgi:RNA polymerase sigma-70 factor (family 1)